MTTRIEHFDCRAGGAYRYVSTDESGEYGFRGCFHDVRPDEAIVQTFSFDGVPDGVALERVTFEALPGGRTRLTATSLVDSFEARDGFVESGMEQGVRECYERLDALLLQRLAVKCVVDNCRRYTDEATPASILAVCAIRV